MATAATERKSELTESRFFALKRDEIRQQQLRAVQPILTPVFVIVLLLSVAFVFMPIGFWVLDGSSDVKHQKKRYDDLDECHINKRWNHTQLPKECTVKMVLNHDMDAPVHFYYQIDNFHQNHRRLVKSKSDDQLRGEEIDALDTCDSNKHYRDKDLYPCGLVAGVFFSDRFRLSVNGDDLCDTSTRCRNYGTDNNESWHSHWDEWSQEPNWSQRDISWRSDRFHKFDFSHVNSDKYTKVGKRQRKVGLRLPDPNNTDLHVWMKSSHLPEFRKLHRVIKDRDLKKGDELEFTILNWFAVDKTNSRKYVVLSTSSWVGGSNEFVAWMFIGTSIVAIILAVSFAALLIWSKRAFKHSIDEL